MKFRNVLVLTLVFIMLLTAFAGCSEKDKGSDASDPSKNVSDNSQNSGDDPVDPDDITTVTWHYYLTGAFDEQEDIWAAVNEITEKELGIHVDFVGINSSDYATQLKLAIANNETVDICHFTPVSANSFTSLYSTGSLMGISDIMEENGQDILACFDGMEAILNGVSVDGELYAIPNYRDLNAVGMILFRVDMLEQAGMYDKMYSMTTWAEYEEVLAAVTDLGVMSAFGGTSVVSNVCVFSGENLKDSYKYDYLGDTLYVIWTNQEGDIDLIYNRADAIDMYKMIADWSAKGYYYSDSAINQEANDSMVAAGAYAGYFNTGTVGSDKNKSQAIGTEVIQIQVTNGIITTGDVVKFGLAIASTSKEPEAAVKLLNYLYTSEELMNLLVWGIEDQNYQMLDTGEAGYLEGKDSSTCGYHSVDFLMGNQFLVIPWSGNGVDYYKNREINFRAADVSKYCGLTVDTADATTLVANLSAVLAEYSPQMNNGRYTDELYNEFMGKLEAAGVSDYLDLYKAVFDDFND